MHATADASGAGDPVGETREHVRLRLARVAEAMRERGVPVPHLEGKLLRPSIAYAMVPPARRAALSDDFWFGALAIQMVHEASLLHDDILDDAAERRGTPSLNASSGAGPALVLGDHYLTGAYRAAVSTGSMEFLKRFIVAVERTVAGEVRQARSSGIPIDLATYFDVVLGKSGELLGAATCLGAAVLGTGALDERASLGRQIGALYQQVDDLLDYCTLADTGKEPLKDYRQQKWTWLLEIAGIDSFDLSEAEVTDAVFGRGSGEISVAERAVRALEVRRDGLLRALRKLDVDDGLVAAILDGWLDTARAGVARQLGHALPRRADHGRSARQAASDEAMVAEAARRIGGPEEWPRYFAANARTFGLAARLFPAGERRRVAALYSFCRFTDDLVDSPAAMLDPTRTERLLEAWAALVRESFDGQATGIELLDRVMTDARESNVSWRYPGSLLRGAAMDLRPAQYASWDELRSYTFCVAGAVGGWMSQLLGVRDPRVLDQAHALGHAMQLTNILRDVGEDLGHGRLYVPTSLLDRHSISVPDLLLSLTWSAPTPAGWPAAMEELMTLADEHYAEAREGIRHLPTFFRRPVAVAAEAYRGIHREIRRNGYDNLRRRAHASLPTKLSLGVLGLLRASGPIRTRMELPERVTS